MQTSDSSYFFRAEHDVSREEARKAKAERIKDTGAPISVPGKILDMKVEGPDAWLAESGHVVRKLSLETGKTLQIYRGHTGPVTCLAFVEQEYLITGSWDKTLKVWRISDQKMISSVNAHNDFVKCLLVVPSLLLIISGSSDRTIRIWDAQNLEQPIRQIGTIVTHTRPVEAFAFQEQADFSGVLYTSDSLGAVKVWDVQRPNKNSLDCRITLRDEWQAHRTGINTLFVACDLMFTGSSDESVIIQKAPRISTNQNVLHNISQPYSVKALLPLFSISEDVTYLIVAVGDLLRVYSYDPLSAKDPPELLREFEAHSHDITSLGLWINISENVKTELWITSASLDSTLRRWCLHDILTFGVPMVPLVQPKEKIFVAELTKEEESELAELMEDA